MYTYINEDNMTKDKTYNTSAIISTQDGATDVNNTQREKKTSTESIHG